MNNWLKDIKVIGWDLDGTLYPADPKMIEEINFLKFKKVAEVLEVDESLAEEKYNSILDETGSNTLTLGRIGIDGKEFFTNVWDNIELKKYIKQDPRINKMFDSLSVYPHFMLSNANKLRHIKQKLEILQIELDTFAVIFDTIEQNLFKPDPLAYIKALNLTNQTLGTSYSPDQVLYVGDRDETDINGAKAAGMRTCIVGKKSDVADIQIDHVSDLVSILAT